VAARNVVDGKALVIAFNANQVPFATDPELPKPGTPDHTALTGHIGQLNDLFDAVSDLLSAESMYQLAQGNVIAAQSASDALMNGARPPEIEVARSRHPGSGPPAPGANWPSQSPRSVAEPFVDGWIGQLLGDPDKVRAQVEFTTGGPTKTRVVSLKDLSLRPLDVLALARSSPESTGGSTLERRLIVFVSQEEAGSKEFKVVYKGFTPAPAVTFPEVLVVARAAAAVLGGARPMRAVDLVTPSETDEVEEPGSTAQELEDRVSLAGGMSGAKHELSKALSELEAATTRATRLAKLQAAAAIAPEQYPDVTASDADVTAAATAAAKELRRRLTLVEALEQETPSTTAARVDRATRTLKAIFGDDFFVLAGLGQPPGGVELKASLAGRAALLPADIADAPAQLLQQMGRVRDGMARWRKLTLLSTAVSAARARLDLVQLPHVPGATWAGGKGTPPETGRVSILLLGPTGAPALDPTTQSWRGLVLDDWVEVVPSAQETTGVAFHYDGPNAEAGNTILIAVPSSASPQWSFAELLATLQETFDLVELRAIDPDILGLGQLLPAIFLASNTKEQTPASNFTGSFANDHVVIEV
jgi:hypothetical protein